MFHMGINYIHNVPLSVVFGQLCQQVSRSCVLRRMVMKSCDVDNVITGKINNSYSLQADSV